ncbi:MAG: hypothetical protein V4588_06020 [Pseudomonadota bacterium]
MQQEYGGWGWRSELLTVDGYQALLQTAAKVLERNEEGVKVARLENGDILKVFRVKHLISSARIFSYGRSFCRNSQRLAAMNIPTVQVKNLYHLQGSSSSAVVYLPLEGNTVMELLRSQRLTEALSERLGGFIAHLHDSGVYFRGLHMGNIVLTPSGEFGLIDISEMTIFPWRLSRHRRLRNFARFWRNVGDKFTFGQERIHALVRGYRAGCKKINLDPSQIENTLM